MPIDLYDATVASYLQILGATEGFLQKGLGHFQETGVDPAEIVETRLYPDMAPFRFQVNQIVRHSLGAIEGVRKGVFEPDGGPEVDYAGLQKEISAARAALEGVSREEVEGFVGRDMAFQFREMKIPYTAENFLLSFSLPNFYFHATVAYGILRHKGVPVGKRDFMGKPRIKT
jgi:hypothetical protein